MDPFLQQLYAYQQAQAQAKAQKAAYSRYPAYFNYDDQDDDPYGNYSSYFPARKPQLKTKTNPLAAFYNPAYYNGNQYPVSYYNYLGGDEDDEDDETEENNEVSDKAKTLSKGETEGDDDEEEEDGGYQGYSLNGIPLKGSSAYPGNIIYFTNPKPKQAVKPASDYSELFGGNTNSIPSSSGYRSFDPSSLTSQNKRQRQQKQQLMYVMDRYGNLYPYQPAETATPAQPEKKEIDANELIRMLLGGSSVTDDDDNEKKSDNSAKPATEGSDEKEDEAEKKLEEAAISKAINDELEAEAKYATEQESKKEQPTIEETPLTREGLADILSQLAAQSAEEDDKKKAIPVSIPSATPIPTAIPAPIPTSIPASIPMSIPPKIRRKSTAPSLNVHKVSKPAEDETETNTKTSDVKPTVVSDVKVSAPQLKKKNLPFSPPLNVYEFKNNYIVVISLPGVSKEFVDIDYHPTSNELVVKGEVKNKYLSDDDEASNDFVLKVSEQRFGNFERIVKLPAYPGIEDSKIKARFLNGLLEIKLPKVDESKLQKEAKKIQLEDIPDAELERESGKSYI